MWDPEFALEKEILTDPYRSIQIHTRFWDPASGMWKGVRLQTPDSRPRLMRRLLLRRQPPLLPAFG